MHIVSDTISTDVVGQNNTPKIAHTIISINNKVLSDLLPIQNKTSKWNYLPKRDMSMCMYKLAEHCRLLAINDANSAVNLTFIVVTNEPRTYYEVLCSFYLSE